MSDIVTRLRRWTHDAHAAPASDIMDEASAEIERLRSETSRLLWIPYTERRPENGQKILAVFQAGHGEPWVELAEFHDHDFRDGGVWRSCRVLCWMPLPEPPEVK